MTEYNVTSMTRGKVYVIPRYNSDIKEYLTLDGYSTKHINDAPYMTIIEAIKAAQYYIHNFDITVDLLHVFITSLYEEDLSVNNTDNPDRLNPDGLTLFSVLSSKINSHIRYGAYYLDSDIKDVNRKLYVSYNNTGYSSSVINREYKNLLDLIEHELRNQRADITKLQVYPLGFDRVPHDALFVVDLWLKNDSNENDIYQS